jgi:hypothetical protein
MKESDGVGGDNIGVVKNLMILVLLLLMLRMREEKKK